MGEMYEKSDAQLLRDYAQQGDEAAFAELVNRHTNLVYSAAARQVDSPDLAVEVAQSAFIGLAHGARSLLPRLTEDASLAGWLCRSARNISLNLRRDEFRRHSRERQAMEHFNPISETATDWERLRPVLDDAMSELDETDYDALVMRFFKNQHLRSIGLALGVSDDTAQKRVSRALDKLREHLSRRGIDTTATALSVVLTANAVQAAPVGLAVAISSAAIAGTTLATTATATKAIAMTTLQKTLIAATIVTAVGTGIYEARHASSLRSQNQLLTEQHSALTDEFQNLSQSLTEASKDLAAVRQENEQLRSGESSTELLRLRGQVAQLRLANAALVAAGKDPTQTSAKSWLDRVNQLKERLEQTPSARIPEFKLLSDDNWLNAASGKLESDEDYRRAFAQLRSAVENQFIISMQSALQKFMKESNGQFPSDLSQLKPHFEGAPDDAMLQRYAIVPAASIPDLKMGGDWLITVKTPVDEEFDSSWGLGPSGFGTSSYQGMNDATTLAPALKAYESANNGLKPQNPSDLLPYVTTPEQRAVVQKLEQKRIPTSK